MNASLFRLRCAYPKSDRLSFLGHLELIATVERSIRRAGLPFAVSNGFARRMRIQFSSALPVGVSSLAEYFDLFLTERLDEDDALVTEPGEQGEICVSGTALGLGYLGDAERTAASFCQNPLNRRWLEPIYRTGDLGRFDEDGNLVYVSRKDHQIKHMGHRIELGDIEAAAMGVDGVERTCCLYDSRRKKLRLFYVGSIEKDALAESLHALLPSFMVPNAIRQIDAMPLTKNGKIDRNALADLK